MHLSSLSLPACHCMQEHQPRNPCAEKPTPSGTEVEAVTLNPPRLVYNNRWLLLTSVNNTAYLPFVYCSYPGNMAYVQC